MADTKSMMDVTASPINEKMKNALKKEAKKLAEKGMERGDAVAKIHGMGKFSSVDETTIESIFDTEAMTVRRKKEEKATKTSTTSAKPVSTADVPSPTTSTDSATKNGFVKWVKNHPVKTGLIALATVVLAATAITGICHCVKYLGNQEEQPPVVNGFTKEDLDKAKEEGKEEGLVSGKTEGQNEANQQNALQNKRNTLKNFFADAETAGSIKSQVQRAQNAKARADKSAETVPAAQGFADLAGDEYNNATSAENNALNALNGRDIDKMTEAELDELTTKAKAAYDEAKEAANRAEDYASQADGAVQDAIKAPVELTFDTAEVERVAGIVKGANLGMVTDFKTSTYLNGTLTLYFNGADQFGNKGIYRTQVTLDNPQYTTQDVINALETQCPASQFFASERKGVKVEDSELDISSKDENGNVQNATMEDVSVNFNVTYNKSKDRTTIKYTIIVELADGTFSQYENTIIESGKLTKDDAYKLIMERYLAEHKVEQTGPNTTINYDDESNTATVIIEEEQE